MSEPATINEVQHMLDRAVERISTDYSNRLSDINFRLNQIGQDVQALQNETAKLVEIEESSKRQPEQPQDNTFRM